MLTEIEEKALKNEVKLNRGELFVAFKRLVNLELRIEAIEKIVDRIRGT